MTELVEGLLAVARGDEGAPPQLAPADLNAVAAEAVDAARAAAGGKVVIEYVPPKEPVEASFDRDQIYRVVMILLDNAVKYTPEGGIVAADVRREDDRVRLEVSDTGVGIPAEDLPRVFERFYRADPARSEGGAGLGLSIARQIARAHGGEVEAKSKPGKGSTFVLHIPKREPTP
jgi:signal transduction histidine kinase